MLNRKAKAEIKKDLKVQEKLNVEVKDSLAMERTKLANERTLLAYSRTAMALVLAGLTFMKLFEDMLYQSIGFVFILAGLVMAVFGYRRFCKKKESITRYAHAYTPTSPVHAEVTAQEKAEAT
ncbi:YidH family protein [Pontibacter actiniarum]|nr:DUF202 domain-containing protein [Pontibacter actiniarum]